MKSATVKFLLIFVMSAFALSAYAQPVQPAPRDRAYEREVIKEKEIIPYDRLREADVFWEKRIWREIDFREKMNLPFAYPREPFAEILMDLITQDEVTAYSPLDDDFLQPYTSDEIMSKLVSTDTIITYDPDTYEEVVQVIQNDFDPMSVKKIQIKEDWIFDEETSSMVVRILGIAPVRDRIDPNTGVYIGTEIMFWVYYPDLRQHLVRHEVFNPQNDAMRLSFEDLFEMRMFDSYVIKESNVYDRLIENYASGIDAVYESERIKSEIFSFEHDLWEF